MAYLVFVLCALTSFACAVLLFRGYREQRVKLLFWSGCCFACFALGNALLLADAVVGERYDLAFYRSLPVLAGLMVLIYGLVTES
ncbi:MAG TPA: DUF5985 family protein [Gemmatimonadales bacterium]